ncbi:unnamed protein product [Sphenostylis stenocarpa]|uniref:Uncharacterized protein n=1 Tax=Sphenostylis stenocarpa TaxID=92480 RepID=A0AA86RZK7_9FABA|nr:unnamed protein product [Sphenostylis stenocarpa]
MLLVRHFMCAFTIPWLLSTMFLLKPCIPTRLHAKVHMQVRIQVHISQHIEMKGRGIFDLRWVPPEANADRKSGRKGVISTTPLVEGGKNPSKMGAMLKLIIVYLVEARDLDENIGYEGI